MEFKIGQAVSIDVTILSQEEVDILYNYLRSKSNRCIIDSIDKSDNTILITNIMSNRQVWVRPNWVKFYDSPTNEEDYYRWLSDRE